MRMACVVVFATALSLSPMFPLGLDGEDGYHDAARRAAYAPFLACVSSQRESAMGFLLGVEYVVLNPFYALLKALHIWAWRDNPHGTFVDFNPNVSCDGFVPSS
jgi:hypothetical protein